MSNNHNNGNFDSNTNNTGSSHSDHGQHHAGGGHDLHGQPGVPLMHRTVDELLSAEFPLGIGSVRHPDGSLNNGVQGNIMEGLDDLFNDDFSTVNTNSGTSLHLSAQPQHTQSLSPNIHFSSPTTQSPQNQLSPMHQQQLQDQHRILQHQQSTSAVSPQLAGSSVHHSQQQPQTPGVGQQYQHTSPAAAQRTLYLPQQQAQQSMSQQIPPRPTQSNNVQMPSVAQQSHSQPNAVAPNGQAVMPSAPMSVANSGPSALVPGTASTPIAQAGSPLHHILASTSAATGQQLTHLFSQLQANVLTPGEFMARAKVLLDPAQFEILDGIRRRHGGRPSVDGAQQQSTTASAATLNSGIPSSSPSAGQSSALSMPTAAGTSGMTIHTPATGVPLLSAGATTATPTLAAPPSALQSTSASIPTTSLPPTSSNTGSAPVRKRNTEATFTSTTSAERYGAFINTTNPSF
ncbi:hypothetical protein BC939DRAFT_174339 [Gamsiella multidivaricata]|uniref:uncharacterized protein n=1 Tax=Gamsiella multidivaricata TaxID=101098 RepID=UPI00221FFF4C|nr:uncharacterized protein BC939DRAFT_174339 [Gamsiella multidivaricata]KAI7822946.1 hypothetical protein BC939DRAFT_174339 [Gamsiella multidivaricata]